MANVNTYWDDTTMELINMTHVSMDRKGNRIEIVLVDSHDLFLRGIPQDIYRMNVGEDGIELK